MTWPRWGVIGLRWASTAAISGLRTIACGPWKTCSLNRLMIFLYGSITSALSTTSRSTGGWSIASVIVFWYSSVVNDSMILVAFSGSLLVPETKNVGFPSPR